MFTATSAATKRATIIRNSNTISAQFTEALALAVLLVVACGKEAPLDPYSNEGIEQDLRERPIKVLYAEFEQLPAWTPPRSGELTEWQLESFVQVSRLTNRILEVTGGALDEKIERSRRDDDRFSRMTTAFSAIGDYRNAATARIRASLRLHANPYEHEWVMRQIHHGARIGMQLRDYDDEYAAAKKERDAEPNEYLRSQRQQEMNAAMQQRDQHLATLGDAERANARFWS